MTKKERDELNTRIIALDTTLKLLKKGTFHGGDAIYVTSACQFIERELTASEEIAGKENQRMKELIDAPATKGRKSA